MANELSGRTNAILSLSLSLSLSWEIQGRFAKLPSAINRARLMPEQRQTRVHEFTSEIR